jgi:hypothetical protein
MIAFVNDDLIIVIKDRKKNAIYPTDKKSPHNDSFEANIG